MDRYRISYMPLRLRNGATVKRNFVYPSRMAPEKKTRVRKVLSDYGKGFRDGQKYNQAVAKLAAQKKAASK